MAEINEKIDTTPKVPSALTARADMALEMLENQRQMRSGREMQVPKETVSSYRGVFEGKTFESQSQDNKEYRFTRSYGDVFLLGVTKRVTKREGKADANLVFTSRYRLYPDDVATEEHVATKDYGGQKIILGPKETKNELPVDTLAGSIQVLAPKKD